MCINIDPSCTDHLTKCPEISMVITIEGRAFRNNCHDTNANNANLTLKK